MDMLIILLGILVVLPYAHTVIQWDQVNSDQGYFHATQQAIQSTQIDPLEQNLAIANLAAIEII
jgi:hypothetical protein